LISNSDVSAVRPPIDGRGAFDPSSLSRRTATAVGSNSNTETKMPSNGKSVLVAAFAVALLAAPVSAHAAQPRQAKGVSAKMTPAYTADANINARSNTNAAEDFQSHFAIDY
jgi:hypothetical protein